ncbi:uncharacterized protein LOC127700803 isoform X2 [Mytilus californianus]|uniref:uncharacterized protein LOC127700803 isoform X2 n=1 Tax=Mytilus californianus TaxID=6549 RepID=UPI002247B706|nr:uncharacterized protein LOC127700803 isoform X2 [Mytilus californianus]
MKIRKEDGAIKTVAFQAEYEGLSSDEDTTLQLTSQAGGGKEDKVLILVERLSMYEAGVQSAKSAGDTSKQKRYGRALKTIQDLLQQTHQGKLVDESDIPPRIPVDEPKKQRPEIETEQMIETKRDQYKTTTLQPKQSGDINTAISNVQTAKIPSQMSGHGSPQDRKPVPKIADQVGFGGEKMSTGKRPDRKFEDSPYIQEDSLRIDISDSEEDTSEASLPTMNIVKKMKRVETGCNLLTLEEKKKLRHDMAKDFVPGKPGLISKEFMVLNKDSIYSRYFDSSTTIKGLYNWIVATIPYEMLPAKFILKCLQSCKEVDCCHAFPISTVMDRDVFLRSVPTKLMISPICDNPETTFTCYDEVYFSYGDL